MSQLQLTRRLLEAAGHPVELIDPRFIAHWLREGKAPEEIVAIAGPVRVVLS